MTIGFCRRISTDSRTRGACAGAPTSAAVASPRTSPVSSESGARAFRRHADGQAFSSFGAAALEHLAASRRLHASQKTVRALAPDVARLIGAFHRNMAPLRRFSGKCLYQSHRPGVVNFSRPPPSTSGASDLAPLPRVFCPRTTPRASDRRLASRCSICRRAREASGCCEFPPQSCASNA